MVRGVPPVSFIHLSLELRHKQHRHSCHRPQLICFTVLSTHSPSREPPFHSLLCLPGLPYISCHLGSLSGMFHRILVAVQGSHKCPNLPSMACATITVISSWTVPTLACELRARIPPSISFCGYLSFHSKCCIKRLNQCDKCMN